MTMLMFSERTEMAEIKDLIVDKDNNKNGHGKFQDLVELVLQNVKEEKDDNGNVIKTYTTVGELADEKLKELVDNLLKEAIPKSEELYGKEYKDDFQKHISSLKQNITKVREVISLLFFYTEGEYNIGDSISNTITFIENAPLFAMPHFDEIYLALSRTSNRYNDNYECIKGDNQLYNLSKDSKLSLVFSFEHYLFKEKGKVYVDGKEVSKEDYDIEKGSTIITLSNSYLKTLSEGEHTITLKMDDKEASASFKLTKDPDTKIDESDELNKKILNPKTVDNIVIYISLLGISALLIVVVLIYFRKRK